MEETNINDCKCGDKANWKEVLFVRAGVLPFSCYQLIQCMTCKVITIKEKMTKSKTQGGQK